VTTSAYCSVNFLFVETVTSRQSFRAFFLFASAKGVSSVIWNTRVIGGGRLITFGRIAELDSSDGPL
jgi:hypothetical protein